MLSTEDYEILRMQSHRAIFEKWREIKCQLLNSDLVHQNAYFELYSEMREHHIELMAHMNLLRKNDGLDKIRIKAGEILRNLVQEKIWKIQNPKNCDEGKYFYLFMKIFK